MWTSTLALTFTVGMHKHVHMGTKHADPCSACLKGLFTSCPETWTLFFYFYFFPFYQM